MNHTTLITILLATFIRQCSDRGLELKAVDPIAQTIELSENVQLEYVEQGDPSGTAIIFLHGITDSRHSYDLVLPLLSPGFHAFAITQRGHGGSSKDGLSYHPDDFAKDIADFIRKKQIDEAVIVGHSMGSTNAQSFAIRYPELCKAVVLIGSFASYSENQQVMELMEAINGLKGSINKNFASEFQISTLYNEIPPAFLETAISETMRVPASVFKDILQGDIESDNKSKFHTIKAPVLIIWGDKDSFVPAEDQQIQKNTIPNAKLVIYQDTGHGVHWEKPEKFVQDLEDFMLTLEKNSADIIKG